MSNTASGVRKRPVPDPQEPAVVLTYEDLAFLGRFLGRNVTDRDGLMNAVLNMSTLSVEGVPITLEPRLLQRLRSRCLDKTRWTKWLSEVVVKQLHDYAGW